MKRFAPEPQSETSPVSSCYAGEVAAFFHAANQDAAEVFRAGARSGLRASNNRRAAALSTGRVCMS